MLFIIIGLLFIGAGLLMLNYLNGSLQHRYRIKICTQRNGGKLISVQSRSLLFWVVEHRYEGRKRFRYFASVPEAEQFIIRRRASRDLYRGSKIIRCQVNYPTCGKNDYYE